MARLGLIPVPCLGHCHTCRASSFFGHSPFRRWWRSSLLALHGIEKRSVFLFPAPQVSASGPCFRSVDLFPPGWNGGFHLWRYSRVLSVACFDWWFLPVSRALCAGLPGLLGSLFWGSCLRHVQVVTAPLPLLFFTPFASLVFLELRLRGCWWWRQLRILSGRSPLGVLSARYPAEPRLLLP